MEVTEIGKEPIKEDDRKFAKCEVESEILTTRLMILHEQCASGELVKQKTHFQVNWALSNGGGIYVKFDDKDEQVKFSLEALVETAIDIRDKLANKE